MRVKRHVTQPRDDRRTNGPIETIVDHALSVIVAAVLLCSRGSH